MNAAVETSRPEHQRRRPNSLGQQRSGLADANVDTSQPLTVLIRVPNLDTPRPAARAAAKSDAKPETQAATESNTRASSRTKSNAAASSVTAPTPSSTSNLVGWAWRLMIMAAAVGLVLLAYRIINGPANSPEMEALPTGANVAAESSDATNLPNDSLTAPALPLAPQASDIAAPSTLAPPKLELESPPVQVSPVDVDATVSQPRSAPEDTYVEQGSESPRDERRPWVNANDNEQPHGDGSVRTARSEWDEGWSSEAGDENPRSPNEQQNPYYDNWDSTSQPPPSYDYPETSPNTWRDDGRWESTPRYAPPQHHGAAPPAWDENPHSAMRQPEPGVARLRGEIEQPPLRRDDERNRPGIY